jgi:hypothetical protein
VLDPAQRLRRYPATMEEELFAGLGKVTGEEFPQQTRMS